MDEILPFLLQILLLLLFLFPPTQNDNGYVKKWD